jgi:chromosomal replication initiator protein
MEAIAMLVQHDPYLDVPLTERIAARKDRRDRLFNSPRKATVMLDIPVPKAAIVRAKDPMADAKAHHDLGGSSLDPRLTFAGFSIGRSNNLAHAAARQIADGRRGDPVMFNPLYIHAGVGLGKTHLLQAIALAGNCEDRKVLYLTAEKFVYSFFDSIKRQAAVEFKHSLRCLDVLIIDDLQFLQGKPTHAEFCHTVNAALDGGRQVVLAADRLPSDLEILDERTRSRLVAGLVVEIGRPAEEQRIDILQHRIEAARLYHPTFDIPDTVREFIVGAVVKCGRDIEAAVNRLLAQSKLNECVITLDMAEREIRDLILPTEPRKIRIDEIQVACARHYGVTRSDILSARRTAAVVRPRQVGYYLSKVLTLKSLPEIGRRFGGRDHSSVYHGAKKISELRRIDAQLNADVEAITRELGGSIA